MKRERQNEKQNVREERWRGGEKERKRPAVLSLSFIEFNKLHT